MNSKDARGKADSSVGLDAARLERAERLLAGWVERGRIPGAVLCVGRLGADGAGPTQVIRAYGKLRPDGAEVVSDSLFLVASITKPVTVTAVMLLVERGEIALDDRVTTYLPAFAAEGKGDVRIRHLMTHTSGLPDMPPANQALRASHAPFSRFVEEICKVPLMFAPGTGVSYQSAGIAVLAEIVHQVSGMVLPEFLRKEIFGPLGMADTSLGWDPSKKHRLARVRLAANQEATDWNWNTPYWLGFGAPWGGMITSAPDFSRFCAMFLREGMHDGRPLLGRATVRAMTRNQLESMQEVPEVERRCRPWGLGWRLQWPGHSANFGDLLGPRIYGHWGATGTLCWLDPDHDAFLILFTTQPGDDEGRDLARVSNAVAAALR